jgi:hypothetical protein
MVLQEFGRDGLDHPKARAMLSDAPAEFVIELAGIPHMLVTSELERNLGKARLSVPAARPLGPSSVELPSIGAHVTARLKFPRPKATTPDAGAVGFFMESGSLRIDEQFKLRTMMYEGRIEL